MRHNERMDGISKKDLKEARGDFNTFAERFRDFDDHFNDVDHNLGSHATEISSIKLQVSGLSGSGSAVSGYDFSDEGVESTLSITLDTSVGNQVYRGGYIEIQPDSWDGSLPEVDATTKVWGFPYSLNKAEKKKIKSRVFGGLGKGIQYIRFPLGFAYRGYRDINGTSGLAETIGERYAGQNKALREWFSDIAESGGGLAPEYWCPPPHWVTSGTYNGDNQISAGGSYDQSVTLASIKATDLTQYNAQIDAFTDAIVNDLEYLHQNIAPVRMFGLQNEPKQHGLIYGSCLYDATTYNDILEVLWPKVLASAVLSYYDEEPNEVLLHVGSSDESNPFGDIIATFIANHSDWIWGYSHHLMRRLSGESGDTGADYLRYSTFQGFKGIKTNLFCNEYEYFTTTYGSDQFRCSNNMLRFINELAYAGSEVLMPVIHICKPLGQTLASTNTKGYCLYAVNLNDEFGVDFGADSNPLGLAKGFATENKTMFNSWAMINDNFPIGATIVGAYDPEVGVVTDGGYVAGLYNGKLHLLLANSSDTDMSISITFPEEKKFSGKYYDEFEVGGIIAPKQGTVITFVIPAYSGQYWGEEDILAAKTPTVPVVDTEAPSVPANLTQDSVSDTEVTISWDASTDNVAVTGYKIYRDAVEVGDVAVTTFTESSLSSETSYVYTVSAYDAAANESAQSTGLNVTTDAPFVDTTAPSIPANLTQDTVTSSSVTISWDASTDDVAVTGYKIYRDAVEVGDVAVATFTESGLTDDTTYTYTVSAYDAAANESAQSTGLDVTTDAIIVDTEAPSVPANLTEDSVSNTTATISWDASTDNIGVAGYKVYRDAALVGNVAVTTFADTGLTAETTYTYTVLAYDSNDNESAQSTGLDVTTSAAVAVTYAVQDSFDRADAADLGTADSGQTWDYDPEARIAIVSGVAMPTDISSPSYARINSGYSDVTVAADITYQGYSALQVRSTFLNVGYRVRISSSGMALFYVNGATVTQLGDAYTFTPTTGQSYNIAVTAIGDDLEVFLDGVSRITATDASYSDVTSHGLYISSGTGLTTEFDNFTVAIES